LVEIEKVAEFERMPWGVQPLPQESPNEFAFEVSKVLSAVAASWTVGIILGEVR